MLHWYGCIGGGGIYHSYDWAGLDTHRHFADGGRGHLVIFLVDECGVENKELCIMFSWLGNQEIWPLLLRFFLFFKIQLHKG